MRIASRHSLLRPSWPGVTRPSTCDRRHVEGVDVRVKPAHDEFEMTSLHGGVR
jgi:hypothetical protein